MHQIHHTLIKKYHFVLWRHASPSGLYLSGEVITAILASCMTVWYASSISPDTNFSLRSLHSTLKCVSSYKGLRITRWFISGWFWKFKSPPSGMKFRVEAMSAWRWKLNIMSWQLCQITCNNTGKLFLTTLWQLAHFYYVSDCHKSKMNFMKKSYSLYFSIRTNSILNKYIK